MRNALHPRRTSARNASSLCAWIVLAASLAACSPSQDQSSGAGGASQASASASGGGASASATSSTSSGSTGGGGPSGGLGPATFDPTDLDAPSNGGTITFQQIGSTGWYPSRRDPATGPCDAYQNATCCLAQEQVTSDLLTPWDQDLIMTLRGPMQVKQFAAYQPASAGATAWELVSAWDDRDPGATQGIAFDGDATPSSPFAGGVGSECLVNVSTDQPFACGAGSMPFCPASMDNAHDGWANSKLFVVLARMTHAGDAGAAQACSQDTSGNWYDAPWLGLSLGELVRAGAFGSCHCYAKDPSQWWLADGCGQFNVFEVVNDNNQYKNLDVFSTNMFGYGGYVGDGPCGSQCNASLFPPAADLIDKQTSNEASAGAIATPSGGPGAAFRRPANGYRYFLMLLDVPSRTVQLGIVHPQRIPASIDTLLPSLPGSVPATTVNALLDLRLPGN